jgi:CheY-like chemotaxis protein
MTAIDTKTILVIEDDEVTRAGYEAALRGRGHVVLLTSDGREALDHMQKCGPPDLIIMDMLMKGMDGWEFLKARQPQWGSVPLLIVTGIDTASDEWAASLGACGWLKKPIDTAVLLDQIDKCLRPDV